MIPNLLDVSNYHVYGGENKHPHMCKDLKTILQ